MGNLAVMTVTKDKCSAQTPVKAPNPELYKYIQEHKWWLCLEDYKPLDLSIIGLSGKVGSWRYVCGWTLSVAVHMNV